MNEWVYRGQVCASPIEGMYGFVYLITYVGQGTEEYPFGSMYVGKKSFVHNRRKKVGKKAKLLPENKGKRVLKTTKDSGWRDYYGSSKALTAFIKEVGKEYFRREILCFTRNRAESTYMELKYQIQHEVLEKPSFNNWIGGKVWRSQLNQ